MLKKFLLIGALSLCALPALAHGQEFPGDPQFDPTLSVTRLDFTLAVVDKLYWSESFETCFDSIAPSIPAKFTLLFKDVSRADWYAPSLCIAMRAGLIQGDRDGNFRPFDAISMGEASKIMARAYGLLYPSLPVSTKPWYEGPMLALSIRGAIAEDAKHSDILTNGAMATMFAALQDVERFPETRIIGSLIEAKTGPLPMSYVNGVMIVDGKRHVSTRLLRVSARNRRGTANGMGLVGQSPLLHMQAELP